MTIHRSSTSLLALSLVLPIALVACGGGDSGADPAAPPSTATGGSAGAAAGQGGAAAGGAGAGGAAAGTGGQAAGKGGTGGAAGGAGGAGAAGKAGGGTKADTFDAMMRIAVITDMDTGSAFDVCVTDNPSYNETGDAFDGPLAAKYGPDGGNFISAPGVTTYFGATSKVQYLRLVKSVPSDQVQDVKDGKVNLCSSKERIKGIADDKTALTADDYYTIVIYGSLEDKSSLKTRVIKDDYKAATGDNTALQFFNAVYKTKMRVAYSDGTPLEVFSATDYGKFASQTGLSSAEFQGNYLLTNKFLATELKLENVDKPEDAVPFGDNDFAAGSNYSIFSFRNSAGLLRAYVCEDKPVQVGAFKDPNDESKGRWPTESPTCTFKLPARSAAASPARERAVWRGRVPVPRFRVSSPAAPIMIAAPPSSRKKRGQLETESFAGGGSARSDLCTMLIVTAGGGDVGTTFAVPAGRRTAVGRASECDVVLSDRSISRVHAYFTLGSGALILHDNDSRNGTFVNDARVDRAVPVEPGDSVRLGKVHLRVVVVEAHEAAAMVQLAAATRREEQRLRGHGSVDGTVVSAPAMRRLYEQAHRAAQSPISVLLLGETGVGKEVLARAIHGASPRAGKPFFALNCAALPESLLEAELFGHERGAFTGAAGARVGLFEAASGGTVFLDEVGELSPSVQAKLLRVLDERKVTPLGGHATRAVDVRFVAATNRDLAKEAKQKSFREDLYFRLAGLTLTVPPLRQRKAEIPEFAAFFLVRAAEMARRPPPRMTPEFVRGLCAHDWPGNVRELRNVIERAVVLADGDELLPEHLGEELPRSSRRSLRGASLRKDLDALEKQRILDALEQAEGNQTRAAELLGMPRRTLVHRLGAWGLTRPRK